MAVKRVSILDDSVHFESLLSKRSRSDNIVVEIRYPETAGTAKKGRVPESVRYANRW